MTSKKALMDSLDKDTYTKKEVKHIIHGFSTFVRRPEKPAIGDVFYCDFFRHPVILIKEIKSRKSFLGIAITSTDSDVILSEVKNRFRTQFSSITLKEISCFDKYMYSISKAEAKRHYKLIKELI